MQTDACVFEGSPVSLDPAVANPAVADPAVANPALPTLWLPTLWVSIPRLSIQRPLPPMLILTFGSVNTSIQSPLVNRLP